MLDINFRTKNTLTSRIMNMDINRNMPKNEGGRTKLVKDCTNEDIQYAVKHIHNKILEECDDAYGSLENLTANILFFIRNNNNNEEMYPLLIMTLAALNKA